MKLEKTLLAAFAAVLATPALSETEMPFALDWKFEGPSAPYFHALDAGYFSDADLAVTISEGAGSLAIYGAADVDNLGSNGVFRKLNFSLINTFHYDNIKCNWYEMIKKDWSRMNLD